MLRILILSDGRPGHVNLSYGIAAALARLAPAETTEIAARRGRWPGAAMAMLAASRLPARWLLRRIYGIDLTELPPADIIVSAGAETLAANVWLARARAAPNVFYGSLRLFSPRDFKLVLTSYTAQAARENHALSLKPSRFDPDRMPPHAAPRDAATAPIGLILGGDSGTFTYRDVDWTRLLDFAEAHTRATGQRWLVSNSRRTPAAVSDRIAAIADHTNSPIAEFIDVRLPDATPLAALFPRVRAVVCTDDSSSMISECIWARLPVIGVRPENAAFDTNEQGYRDWLTGRRLYRPLAISTLSRAGVSDALGGVAPLTINPLDELATLLATRLPGLRAPPG